MNVLRDQSALAPSLEFFVHHLEHEGCIGHVAELFGGDAPHVAGGSPAQLWSAAELYRAQRLLTARTQPSARTAGKKTQASKEDMTEKLQ